MLTKALLSLVLVTHTLLPGICASVCDVLGCSPAIAIGAACEPERVASCGTCCCASIEDESGEPCGPCGPDCPAHCCEVPEATPPAKDLSIVRSGHNDDAWPTPAIETVRTWTVASPATVLQTDIPPPRGKHRPQARLCVWLI